MGLQSAFELLLHNEQPLQGFDDLIWQSLSAGAASKKHPWNLGAFSTVECAPEQAPKPHTRTVVLRAANRRDRSVDLYTDVRSDKIDHLESSAAAAWHFYDHSTKIQLRLRGTAGVMTGEASDRVWDQMSPQTRSSYLSITEPGERVDQAQPPDTSDRFVSEEASERGRSNFRIVRTTVESLDWLYLRREGHVRAAIQYDPGGKAKAYWVVP